MRNLIIAIFGTYTPITETVYQLLENPDGSSSWVTVQRVVDGAAGVDWTYVLGVLGFFLILYCAFRILGGVLSAK